MEYLLSDPGHVFLSKSFAHHALLTYCEIVNDPGALDSVLYALDAEDVVQVALER